MSSVSLKRRKNPMLVSKPSEGSMQCSKKSYTNRLQIKEIGLLKNYFLNRYFEWKCIITVYILYR